MSLPELVEAAKVANDAAPRSKPRAGRLLLNLRIALDLSMTLPAHP